MSVFDYAIRNGLIVDGTDSTPFKGTVYIQGDLISVIDAGGPLPAQNSIDASGLIVSPGFIDPHTHSDVAPFCAPRFESAVYQGVTFHLGGNCGFSVVPNTPVTHDELFRKRSAPYYVNALTGRETTAHDVTTYKMEIETRCLPIHMATLVGHGALRNAVMGDARREPTQIEMSRMKSLLDDNLSQGAFGLSLGLTYMPGSCSKTDELIELAKVVAAHDALISVHMRGEDGRVFGALDEMQLVARTTSARIQLSHLKLMWRPQWGKVGALLGRLDAAQAEGLSITADQYPYLASSTGLASLWPGLSTSDTGKDPWAQLDDPRTYAEIREAVERNIERRGGPEATTVANTRGVMSDADGKNLSQLGALWGIPAAEAYCRVMRATRGQASGVYHAMDLADMLEIMKRKDVAVGSDGYAQDYLSSPVLGKPHPRSVGTFPRFFQTVREHKLLPIESAVYKASGLPAKILGIAGKTGALKPGLLGDITIFDQALIEDNATFEEPSIKPEGIRHVFTAGKPVLLNGVQTDLRPGRFFVR